MPRCPVCGFHAEVLREHLQTEANKGDEAHRQELENLEVEIKSPNETIGTSDIERADQGDGGGISERGGTLPGTGGSSAGMGGIQMDDEQDM